jgi:hypothetical protein
LAACVVPDPNHCANRERDATCVELELGPYCSACADANFGCVSQEPEPVCYPDGAATSPSSSAGTTMESGGTDTDTDSEGESSSGPPPACVTDEECPEGNPYCIEGTCGTCDLAPEGFCGERDPGKAVCHQAWGRCVECTEVANDACADPSKWCGADFTCGGCYVHEHCLQSACDMSRGTCLPPENVFYVDNDECTEGTMDGSMGDPFCTIQQGVTSIPVGQRGTVIVRKGNTYTEGILAQNSRTVAVIGQQFPSIIVADEEAVVVSAGDKLYIAGVQVRSTGDVGLRCNGNSELWLDNVRVDQSVTGIEAGPCDLHIHRSEILLNEEVAIQLTGSGDNTHMRMTSSMVVGNSTAGAWPAIRSTTSHFEILYSTVVAGSYKTIECAGGNAGPVRNSVVVSSGLESVDCPWAEFTDSVHDGGDAKFRGDDNVLVGTFDPAWFEDLDSNDAHVNAPGSSPFADVARWDVGDPIRDFDGERRETTPGVRNFAGADEP